MASYRIDVIRRNLTDHLQIVEFTQLRIIDILNGVGSWSLSGVSEDRCPFQIGDFVNILRNNVSIFCGCLTSFEEEYIVQENAWEWSASGKSMNQLLKWKVLFPPADPVDGHLTSRELSWIALPASWLISNLIDNIKGGNNRAGSGGFDVVDGCVDLTDGQLPDRTGSYRFDNVYDSVAAIINNYNLVFYPAWFKDVEGNNKVKFCVAYTRDKSSDVVFDSRLNQVNSFRHTFTCPDATDVIMSYNSEDGPWAYDPDLGPDDPIWQYVASQYIMGAQQWRDYGQAREVFMKPKKEDFKTGGSYTFTPARLQQICNDAAFGMYANSDCYDIDMNIEASPYIYGYDFFDNPAIDYRLGDMIGIYVNGDSYVGKLTKMEFNIAAQTEQVTPTIGGISKGIFGGFVSDLNKLNKSTSKTDTSEVG